MSIIKDVDSGDELKRTLFAYSCPIVFVFRMFRMAPR
jgi:hypothetical protein